MEQPSHALNECDVDDDHAREISLVRAATSIRTWNSVLAVASMSLAVVLAIVWKIDSPVHLSHVTPASNGSNTTFGTSSNVSERVSAKLNNATLPQWKPLPDASTILTKIAFGSCLSQEMPQPHWDTLVQIYQPDVFLLTGDVVYGDCNETTCHHLREAYETLSRHASVQGAAPHLSVYVTLDDHDYGKNNGYGTNPYKETARELHAEFFGVPWTDEWEAQDGVYQARVWGVAPHRLQVILLDTRYMRSPFNRTYNASSPFTPVLNVSQRPQTRHGTDDINATAYAWQMLSERQWQWLQHQLQQPAELRILVSSIQVLTETSPYECWRQLPHEQERLFRLIRNQSVILVSGDIHVGGFYESGTLMEVTSSALTHTVPLGAEYNHHCTTPDVCELPDATRVNHSVYENNFGTVDIDWESSTFQLALRRTESSHGSSYRSDNGTILMGDAGDILVERTYAFPF